MIVMNDEEALALLDKLLQGQKLKDVQELVFCYSWQGWTWGEAIDVSVFYGRSEELTTLKQWILQDHSPCGAAGDGRHRQNGTSNKVS